MLLRGCPSSVVCTGRRFASTTSRVGFSADELRRATKDACRGIDHGRSILRNTPDQRPRLMPHPIRLVERSQFEQENPARAAALFTPDVVSANRPPTAIAVGGIVCGIYARILRDRLGEKTRIRWAAGEVADAATSSSGNQAHISDGRPMYCRKEFLPHQVVPISIMNSIRAIFFREKIFKNFDYLAVNIEWSALFQNFKKVLQVALRYAKISYFENEKNLIKSLSVSVESMRIFKELEKKHALRIVDHDPSIGRLKLVMNKPLRKQSKRSREIDEKFGVPYDPISVEEATSLFGVFPDERFEFYRYRSDGFFHTEFPIHLEENLKESGVEVTRREFVTDIITQDGKVFAAVFRDWESGEEHAVGTDTIFCSLGMFGGHRDWPKVPPTLPTAGLSTVWDIHPSPVKGCIGFADELGHITPVEWDPETGLCTKIRATLGGHIMGAGTVPVFFRDYMHACVQAIFPGAILSWEKICTRAVNAQNSGELLVMDNVAKGLVAAQGQGGKGYNDAGCLANTAIALLHGKEVALSSEFNFESIATRLS